MTLETERLLLRPWQESDAEALYKYARDERVGPPAGWKPHTSPEDSRQVIRQVLSAEGTFAIVLKETGEPVGSVGYFRSEAVPERGDMEIGYWIGVPYWGQGLVPEAVKCLLAWLFARPDTHKVWCGHFRGNAKSRRVIQKCGFRPEFIREVFWSASNQHLIEFLYSIRRQEYFSKYGENQ